MINSTKEMVDINAYDVATEKCFTAYTEVIWNWSSLLHSLLISWLYQSSSRTLVTSRSCRQTCICCWHMVLSTPSRPTYYSCFYYCIFCVAHNSFPTELLLPQVCPADLPRACGLAHRENCGAGQQAGETCHQVLVKVGFEKGYIYFHLNFVLHLLYLVITGDRASRTRTETFCSVASGPLTP